MPPIVGVAPARRRPAATMLAVALGAAAMAGCERRPGLPPPPPPAVALPAGLDTAVDDVVDGDTIVVDGGHHIRLIGVDTPETVHPNRPVECFGPEAADFLAALLPRGTGVRLVGDTEARDAYDRTLAYVYRLPDGLFVNADIVRRGYGRELTIPPNLAHADELVALAGQARGAGRGLWSACPPDG